jgi:hypothetical protein
MAGDPENKSSLKGRDNTKGGSGSVRKEEGYVGSKQGEGVRFKMPENVTDHSCVKGKLKE